MSPALSNLYLHYVLDRWLEDEVQPRLAGRAPLIRFVDDATMVFENESDARRVMDILPKRFGKYGLKLHPDKTRLVDFRRPSTRPVSAGDPGTFGLPGFCHYWSRSRRRMWVVLRKTSPKRVSRAHKQMNLWCRSHQALQTSRSACSASPEVERALRVLRSDRKYASLEPLLAGDETHVAQVAGTQGAARADPLGEVRAHPATLLASASANCSSPARSRSKPLV